MELFGRRPPRKPRRNIAAHVFLGLAAAAVIVLIFTRGGSDQPDPAPDRQPAAAEAVTSSPASSAPVEDAGGPPAAVETSTAAETSAAAETAPEETDGGVPDEEPQGADDPGAAAEPPPEEGEQEETAAGLSAEASQYLLALSAFAAAADGLVSDIGAVNRSWDEEKGDAPDEPSYRARYREAESALEDALRRMRSFHARVQAHPVPASVQALGAGPESLTPRLVSSAEGMLAGLRRPRPDDGSARRAALADFDEAVRSFGVMVDRLAAADG